MNSKPPLLLLHGVAMSAAVWGEVLPMLEERFDLIVPTAPGHRGGPQIDGTASIRALIDSTEKTLDNRGLATVHIAGNSMGGWMAIELARRGRASSVCAFSPAGFWSKHQPAEQSRKTLIRNKRLAKASSPFMPPLLRFAPIRRLVFKDAASHGDRIGFEHAVQTFSDLADCDIAFDLLRTTESVQPLSSPTCPITVAWSGNDRIFPPAQFVAVARQRLPDAQFVILPDVGHVPMIDDPGLCARVIIESACVNS